MSAIRQRIAASKRHGTHNGFIDYYGCISVTNDLIEILEEAEKLTESGEYIHAYSVAALVLINLAKLASSADDSAGGITNAMGYVKNVLEKVCSGVEYGSDDADYILTQSLMDSRNKAFDGWAEFAYNLLLPAARLATVKNAGKLYDVLNELSVKLSQREHSSWYLESDCLVKLAAINAVYGEQAAYKFIDNNLKYDGIRRIAIREAINKGDYTRAEQLCLDKINNTDRDYHWMKEWYTLLFETYEKSGDKNKQTELAENLLVGKRDTHYYTILKKLLKEKGAWDAQYLSLLTNIGNNMPYNSYMYILSQENETQKLLEEVKKQPHCVFDYGKQLAAEFPEQVYMLCLDEIRKQAAEADNRVKYKKVCGAIKKLYGFGGAADTENVIAELKTQYPRRSAMIEELSGLAIKLANPKVKKMKSI